MNRTPLSRRRNLGIIAHIDAGKTTLTERLLWKAGAIHRMGEVHDGAATTDYSEIERERGITIGAAAVNLDWAGHRLTLIDTPGHIDFAIEVERSLRVLDGAVAVFCAVAGVQPQSEAVWRQARRHGVPLVAFVNKMDRTGADFDRVVAQLRERLGARVWPLGRPLGAEGGLYGWVDLVGRRIVDWTDAGTLVRAWNADDEAAHASLREDLIAAVAEHDDTLAEAFLRDAEIDAAGLAAALRRATLAGAGVPVIAGSAFKTKGMELVLDAVVDYLPSPQDRPAVQADGDAGSVALPPDADGPLAALVFKIEQQEHGPLAFVRVYSGRLRVGDTVWASQRGRRVRIGRLLSIQAGRGSDVSVAEAGEIVAVSGWKDAASGESLSAPARPLRLEAIAIQPPVLSWRLVAKAGDLFRLGQALASLAQEDPSFRAGTDADTGESLIWGMGELHLEVKVERLRKEWGLDVSVGTPRVAYQERPRRAMLGVEGKLDKQNGGAGQFARVRLNLVPRDDEAVVFVDCTRGGVVPAGFVAATEKGVRAALAEGPQGYPVVGVEVALVDGETHAVDSTEQAFQRAAVEAVRSALAEAGTGLLEPVMAVDVDTPAGYLGDVLGDLQRRGGRVGGVGERDGRSEVQARAPLARLSGYATALRSLTQGRASATMRFDGYEAALAC